MKNLPIYGAARRLAVFSVFRSGQKHAASKKTHGQNDRALHFLTSASGMAKPSGTAHSVSDLARRAALFAPPGHHSDLLAGPLTPFRRRVLLSHPSAPSVYSIYIT